MTRMGAPIKVSSIGSKQTRRWGLVRRTFNVQFAAFVWLDVVSPRYSQKPRAACDLDLNLFALFVHNLDRLPWPFKFACA